ncbi:hypothetical protein PUN28_010987 [Cardiocondyla obscurior]|uniref:Uncharacterized protein n=1 Tax=Cardiocondyla obscurior TaxID=286306 RepID=A0AAW2FPJ7_9HYME
MLTQLILIRGRLIDRICVIAPGEIARNIYLYVTNIDFFSSLNKRVLRNKLIYLIFFFFLCIFVVVAFNANIPLVRITILRPRDEYDHVRFLRETSRKRTLCTYIKDRSYDDNDNDDGLSIDLAQAIIGNFPPPRRY